MKSWLVSGFMCPEQLAAAVNVGGSPNPYVCILTAIGGNPRFAVITAS